jgi:hypothetical protein
MSRVSLSDFLLRHPHAVATRVDFGPAVFRTAGVPEPATRLDVSKPEELVVWGFTDPVAAEKFARIFARCVVSINRGEEK